MKITCKQNLKEIDGKLIAYVDTTISDDKYTYRVLFDKQTKKRFNAFLKSKGFIIGEVAKDTPIEDKEKEI